MDYRQLSDGVSVSPQITAEDVPAVKAAGFRAIVCNRPDGEGAGQPPYAEIARAAEAEGLAVRYQPVISGQITDEDAATFAALLDELPGPVLAYCRSGTRCTQLWQMSGAD